MNVGFFGLGKPLRLLKYGLYSVVKSIEKVFDTSLYPWVLSDASGTVNGEDIDMTMDNQRPFIKNEHTSQVEPDTDYLIVFDVSINTFNSAIRPASAVTDCWADVSQIIPYLTTGEFRAVRKTKADFTPVQKVAFIAVAAGTGRLVFNLKMFKASDFANPLTDALPES